MSAQVFDTTPCSLGEGPLWHPQAQRLFWFDINAKRLFAKGLGETAHADLTQWQFDEHVSAAGWLDTQRLLIASETQLMEFDTQTGESSYVTGLEADNPVTRSNDGRADPWGGFWIGTMGKGLEPQAGAIYRYHQGVLRKLFDKITIPNAICFAPDGAFACFTDTPSKLIQKVPLDPNTGWPAGDPVPFIDLSLKASGPDGAVMDHEGTLWLAEWGAGRVTGYGSDGAERGHFAAPATQISCPSFGGPELTTLFATSAAENLSQPDAAQGQTFCWDTPHTGQAEHQVRL